MPLSEIVEAAKRKFSPNNSFWSGGIRTRSKARKPCDTDPPSAPNTVGFAQQERGRVGKKGNQGPSRSKSSVTVRERWIVRNAVSHKRTASQDCRHLQQHEFEVNPFIPHLLNKSAAPSNMEHDQQSTIYHDGQEPPDDQQMDQSDISELHLQRNSDSDLELEIIENKLKDIEQDVETLKNLKTLRDGITFATAAYDCINKKASDLNKKIVLMEATEKYSIRLMRLLSQTERAKNEIDQMGPPPQQVHPPTRRMSTASATMDEHYPVFTDQADRVTSAAENPQSVDILQAIHARDNETAQIRLSERLGSISNRLEIGKESIAAEIASLRKDIASGIATAKAANSSATSNMRAVQDLSARLTKAESFTMDINKYVETIETRLESLKSSLSQGAIDAAKLEAERRIQAHTTEMETRFTKLATDFRTEVNTALKREAQNVKFEILKELTPLLQNLKTVPNSDPSVGHEGKDQLKELKQQLDKVQNLAYLNKSRTEGLISAEKQTRAKLAQVESMNATPMRTSTPIDPNSSKLTSDLHKHNLKKVMERIGHHTKSLNEDDDIATIRKRHEVDVPKLRKDLENLSKLLPEYLKSEVVDDEFYKLCIKTSDGAEAWIHRIEDMYEKRDVHTVDNERNKAPPNIAKFTGDHKQTVFEFLEEFEAAYLSVGVSKTRASIMHKSYLSEWIKGQTTHVATDYGALRSWLIDKHGDIITITSKLLQPLEQMKKPSPTAYKERLEVFSSISDSVMRIERLASLNHIPVTKVNEHLHSRLVLDRLFGLLPSADDIRMMENLRANGLDTRKFEGWETFSVYKSYIHAQVDDMQRAVERMSLAIPQTSAKQKQKVNTISSQNHSNDQMHTDSESDDDTGHPKLTLTVNANKGDQWWTNGLKFPCPILNHNHEIGTCKDFFALSPSDRRAIPRARLTRKRKICWSCLRPTSVCKKTCKSNPAITDVLKCQGCMEFAIENDVPTLSPLYCTNTEHNELKPKPAHFLKELKRYFKGNLSQGVSENNLALCNFAQVLHSSKQLLKSDDVTANNPPAFDTQTGEEVDKPAQGDPGRFDDALFLLQWITIGSAECLVLFDRGSNCNLIDGKLAEEQGLQLVSEAQVTIKVAGGEDIPTQHGTYRVTLGSKETGQYHTLECLGMNGITAAFSRHNLKDINDEARQVLNIPSTQSLPPFVGGAKASLLIGIKDVNLDPVRIGTLESGVAIYRSPFTDKFGSDICYGGGHTMFANQNKVNGNANFVSLFTKEIATTETMLCNNLIEDNYNKIRILPTIMDEDGILTNTTPLTLKDIGDLNCQKEEEDDLLGTNLQVHFCSVYKAKIPISKMRQLIDQDDLDDTITYRCPACSKCITCKRTSKQQAGSIQDAVDQKAVRDSIKIKDSMIEVDTPFTQNPDDFLIKRHGGPDNKQQAMRVYKTQCKHSERLKEGMRKVHADLVQQGFIEKLSSLPPEHLNIIENAPFRHFMPWRIVERTDSESTPVRMVVDPTMTGMNLILPKGENNLGRMNDIIMRARTGEYMWTTDIKKMYNQLKLSPQSLRFQLMLYHDMLDPLIQPEIWVMKTAWYGMTPAGNQAGEAVNMLNELHSASHPHASIPLSVKSRFVDDIVSIAMSEAERNDQIKDVRDVLALGGFNLKFIVKSGQEPDHNASADGTSVKVLGYKYYPKDDLISPMFSELNLNKKVRGSRKPNKFPVTTTEDALCILKSVKVTRRLAMSKLAEFFDPIGIFEPIKLQLKIALSGLNEYEWDEPIPDHLQEEWKPRLAHLMDLPSLKIPRNVIPPNHGTAPIRLLCISDAGENAGGAAIYAGVKLSDGTYSCGLLAAKSKLMSATVPRNELSAIMLMTELAFVAKRALGDRVEEILYVTDSTIAISWCLNTSLKLRLYVYNRVETIRRMIDWTTNSDSLPLYWIESEQNIADIITKPRDTTTFEVAVPSEWQQGKEWMTNPSSDLPLLTFEQLKVPSKKRHELDQECFNEPFFIKNKESVHPLISNDVDTLDENLVFAARAAAGPPRLRTPFLVDLIKFGWSRSIRITSIILNFKDNLKHRVHIKKSIVNLDCPFCCKQPKSEILDQWIAMAEREIFRNESKNIMANCSKSDWSQYTLYNGILYHVGRLSRENPLRFRDLDSIPFLDAKEIQAVSPVVLADSEVLFSYLMEVHMKITPHAGVITTTNEIAKKMHIPTSPRALIQQVRKDCTRCRIILKRTVELEMQKHAFPRTMIAPPFYNAMVDIAYGFPGTPYKNARKRISVYALVIVCILTGATNIIAMEGIETQDVVAAIETHSARYGVPAELFIDNGTQLKAMETANFSIRDVNAYIFDACGIRISVSSPKSHEERGRVERKIRLVRDMIEKMVSPNLAQSPLQWQALFAKISNTLDDVPIAKGTTSNSSHLGFEILTPNRIKMGRNNNRSLVSAGISIDTVANPTRLLEHNRQMYHVWYELFIDNLHLIALKPNKWHKNSRQPEEGDIIMFIHSDAGYQKKNFVWKLGKVLERKGHKVKIQSFTKKSKRSKVMESTFDRNVRDVSIVFSADELYVNSRHYFENLNQPDDQSKI